MWAAYVIALKSRGKFDRTVEYSIEFLKKVRFKSNWTFNEFDSIRIRPNSLESN